MRPVNTLSRSRSQVPTLLYIVGWVLLVAVGAALVWYGFFAPQPGASPQPTPTEPSGLAPLQTPGTPGPPISPLSTDTPPSAVVPEPTVAPPTPTEAAPGIVAGEDGVNVRTGPGINYALLGYLQPGSEAPLTGRYEDWWQVLYNGSPGWVFGELVTARNGEAVPQVEPPPTPLPPPTATPVPPTDTPVPTAPPEPTSPPQPTDFRGLVANAFWVEDAPGPFAANSKIWFQMDVTNTSGGTVEFREWGVLAAETDQFQKSWTNETFAPGQHRHWRDRIIIPAPGTYNLWMRICFRDGQCYNMMGPVEVVVK